MTGIKLKSALIELKLSQAEFGRRIGVSSNSVSKWVTGQVEIPRVVGLYVSLILDLRVICI